MLLPAFLETSLWVLHIPFSEEVKYWALGGSVFLFLLAMCILIWKIHRYRKQLTVVKPTGTFLCNPHNYTFIRLENKCLSVNTSNKCSKELQ